MLLHLFGQREYSFDLYPIVLCIADIRFKHSDYSNTIHRRKETYFISRFFVLYIYIYKTKNLEMKYVSFRLWMVLELSEFLNLMSPYFSHCKSKNWFYSGMKSRNSGKCITLLYNV